MIRFPRLTALAIVLLLTTLAAAADRDADERTLREARVATDGPSLLEFFRKRTVGGADRDKIAALIKQLGDDSFDEREKASTDLIALGARAESFLRDAAEHSRDAEIKRRAEDCLGQLAKRSDPALLASAARVLGARKPDGAAEVLLAYLPDAPGELVADEVCSALAAVALKDGKADPALLKALEDKLPAKRAAAAVALCRAAAKEHLPAVRKLLQDRETAVRFRVAVALAFARDKEAVPALIDLLADLPQGQGYEAEEILRALAEEAAPDVPLGKEADERKKARAAWEKWWKKSGDKLDMARLADGVGAGRTLIIERSAAPGKTTEGRVMEVGRDGGVRWKIEGLQAPLDAQLLPGGRVLILESAGRRITERTTKGEIVWEKTLPVAAGVAGVPLAAQRLANGNTFVVTRTGVFEMDRDGKEVWNYRPTAGGSIYTGRKSRTGEVAIVTLAGTCVLLDAKGKEVSTFAACRPVASGGMDLLPNGNVLVPNYAQSKVVEFDAKGKVVWEANVERPGSAVRLPNGHTLVSCPIAKRVVELDRDGKEVWKCETEGRPYKAYRP
ncbi:MAG TPA: PQQ-binding-like beta-propeller repeat protein [Gemmataceae bacterium]|nr:PQQ-binding-like beta-propeller repeat protein [Gemmataceae bacterium]